MLILFVDGYWAGQSFHEDPEHLEALRSAHGDDRELVGNENPERDQWRLVADPVDGVHCYRLCFGGEGWYWEFWGRSQRYDTITIHGEKSLSIQIPEATAAKILRGQTF